MKRIAKYLFGLIAFFGFTCGVDAANVLFKCNYKADLSKIVTTAKTINFSGTVYDNGTATFSSFDSLNGTDTLGGNYIVGSSGIEKKFHSAATADGNSCPKVNFVFDGNTNISISMSDSFTEKDSSMTVSGTYTAGTVTETKEENLCEREKPLRNDRVGVNIRFYKVGNTKKWSVTGFYIATGTSTGNVTQSLSLGEWVFQLESSVIDKFFSTDDCEDISLYLDTPAGSTLNTVTLKKPSDVSNGSYSSNKAPSDTGKDLASNSGANGGDGVDVDYTTSTKTCVSCGDGALTGIPMQLPKFTTGILFTVQLLVPIILIILGIIDFTKAVAASDEKAMGDSQKKFIKRVIAALLIFFVIAIVKLVFGLIPDDNILGCVSCFTTNDCESSACTSSEDTNDKTVSDMPTDDSVSGSTGDSGNSGSGSSSSGNSSTSDKKYCSDYSSSDCPSKDDYGYTCRATTAGGRPVCQSYSKAKYCANYSTSDCPDTDDYGNKCEVNTKSGGRPSCNYK